MSRHYKPFGSARDIWQDRSPEILLSGPAGTGKSRACLEKLHACALRFPGMRGLIVRKTRESLTESALVTFESKVLPEGSSLAAGSQRATRQVYRYPNGSEIIVGGMKQSGRDMLQKVMSTEYDMIYAQELIEFAEDEFEKLTTRLRNGVMPFQQIIGDTNPDAPNHWLKRRESSGTLRVIESRHEDNPVLWDAVKGDWTPFGRQYIATLDRLTGVRKERLRHGRWVQAEGVVYEGWDRRIHLIDPFVIPSDWRRVRSIDFGYSNPFVCQWWAVDHDARMYLYREIYRTRRTVKVHAEQIRKLSALEEFEQTAADHDAEDRATLHESGISSRAARKFIRPGIQAVEERLKVLEDGKARLYVFNNALVEVDPALVEAKRPLCTAEEFDSYVWPKGQDGKALKEVPVDDHNHGMDAMRYAVMAIDRHVGPQETADQREARERAEAESRVKAQEEWMNPGNPAMWGDDDP